MKARGVILGLALATLLLGSVPAGAAPLFVFSATVGANQDSSRPNTCHVSLNMRNNAREVVSMYGRVEGLIGKDAQPSYRPLRYDAVQPGRTGTEDISFDGDCSQANGPGQVIVMNILVCKIGLAFREDCLEQSATALDSRSGRPPLEVRIEARPR
jgi:hypothetical protein